MPTFKRALVALDRSEMDAQLLRFLKLHAAALGIQKLYVLHVMRDFSAPSQIDADFQQRFAPEIPPDEQVEKALGQQLQDQLGANPGFEVDLDVREGKPYEKLLHWLGLKRIDLLLLGKKAISEGSGITAKRVARHAECAVLFLPQDAPGQVGQIVVANDFSENAERALKTSLSLSSKMGELPVHSLYIVDLPPDNYYSTSSDQGYPALLLESAKEAGAQFRDRLGIAEGRVIEAYRENPNNRLSAHLLAYADEQPNAMIVMGAKGHSALQAFLFGSVTEQLAQAVARQPLLIVR